MSKKEKPTFEQNMEELESIIKKLEEGNSPLEDMVALYERGAKLGEECTHMLDDYQGRIETLQKGMGETP
ncbi:exodeoxyribonuclease VII small subunit [Eubacteriales bacterium OttesenSCG-928-K08]|nr:exodeoxyribonuclease VII small subunit [Eubacteriales bacterium OttesenSCG-928-K08]